jgi:AP-5 complex subunit beta-1
VLLVTANRPNHVSDYAACARLRRLRTLDATLPGLLAEVLGHLYALAGQAILPPPARLRYTPRCAPREARLERFHPGGSRPAHPLHHTFSPALVSRCPWRHHRNVRDIRKVLALLMDRP